MTATVAATAPAEHSARTRVLLDGPIASTLLRLAWPNVLVMFAQAASGLIETFWVSRLGIDALTGMALVFPGIMLMQMISNGAMGGGISSAVARALGGRRRDEADALVTHAVVIDVALGALFTVLALVFGPQLYTALGGHGASLDAALKYSNVVFAGMVLIWLSAALTSVIRGTGNMLVPALVICGGVVLLIPLSPLLIFGIGPFPALGIAGGGVALIAFYAAANVVLLWYLLSGRAGLRVHAARLRWPLFHEILRIGAVASVTTVQSNLTIGITTALVGHRFGTDAVAGYGTGARLEYLLVPLAFGVGGPLVAMVGANIGAGNRTRAIRVAFTGAAIAFAMTEAVGIAAAIWPDAWLRLFGNEPGMLAAGGSYLRAVGPFFGFFGAGMALYFASQGAGRLAWPLVASTTRFLASTVGGWALLQLTGSMSGLFAALAVGLVLIGTLNALAIARGAWFPAAPRQPLANSV
jgi:putative MATE family efflux protein